uniref:Uncharacterized protein LOC105852608 n=1 Tax=Cicer arietinum TaxID=3827 RepID=A0A1S3EFN7_CICAR|nr:uncharacterized protein LOC105852608 [Cicer arietinum]
MARSKVTAKRKISYQEPEENQDVHSSTESDYHEETQNEANSMNTISSSHPSKSSSPSITPKISKNSSSSAPSRRSSRIMSGVVSSNKAPPQDNTIYVINSDDSETTLPTPAQQSPHAKSTSNIPTPKKAKPSSPKPTSSSTKNSEITSMFDSAELDTLYISKWQNKYVVNGSKGTTNLSIVLKGVHMEINSTTLCQILDIHDEGAHCLSETWYSQCVITRTSVLQSTLIKPPKPLVASKLVPLCRILHNIGVHSITPWADSFEKVTELDLMIIHHLITGTPLHLGHVIFTFMLNVVVMGRSAPYGMILTKIFKFFKIPLEDEHSIHFNNTFSMKNIKQMKIQNDDCPASKKRKARPSSSLSQKSEAETTQPPPEDTPSPLIPEPTSPLRNSPDTTPSPDSPTTQSSPIHKLTPLHEADPILEDTFTSTPLQNMEDVRMDEDALPPPDFSQQIPPAANIEKPSQPLPEVTDVLSSLTLSLLPRLITIQRTRLTALRIRVPVKDPKKVLHRFTHFQNSLVQFGLILEWVTKHLVPTIAPGDHPLELPAQLSSDVPSPSSSSD